MTTFLFQCMTVLLFPGVALFIVCTEQKCTYCKVSNISRTLVDNKIVDHTEVVGASPVGAAPTTS